MNYSTKSTKDHIAITISFFFGKQYYRVNSSKSNDDILNTSQDSDVEVTTLSFSTSKMHREMKNSISSLAETKSDVYADILNKDSKYLDHFNKRTQNWMCCLKHF
jgi:hypothetical protein